MLLALLTLATITISPVVGDEIDRHQLIQLIDTAQQANCRDVSFDYEGKRVSATDSGLEQVEEVYTGSFRHRSDGATLTTIYKFDPTAQLAKHGIVAILGKTTSSSSRRADQKKASVDIKEQGPLEYAGPSNFREIWLTDLVKKFATSDYVYEFEGLQQFENAECVVVRFRLVYPGGVINKAKTVSKVFWIDLNRGGHVVRYEGRAPGDRLSEATTVRLQRFEPRLGHGLWLPSSGKFEGFVAISPQRKQIFLDKSAWSTNYDLLPLTLQVDRGLPDDVFSVKPRTGDVVSDQIRKAQYEFGQYMVRPTTVKRGPTDAEVRGELDRMLKDSTIMATELKATSPSLERSTWWARWPWVIAGLSLVAVGLIYHRQWRS